MATEEQLRNYLKKVTVELTQTRRRLAEVEERRREPIAIVGMACRFPGGGDTIDGYWKLLLEGRTGVTEVPASRFDIDEFYNPDPAAAGSIYTRKGSFLDDIAGWDAEFFGLPPREALRLDPRQRLLLELSWEGLENAGASATRLAGSRVGVMVGFLDTGSPYTRLQFERQGRSIIADPYLGQGTSLSVAAGRISYYLNLTGPAITIDTACSSSLIAIHLAVDSLRRGECDLAIAAGASMNFHPDDFIQGCASSMLCPDGTCKTFDERANGYVMGEGGGAVILEPLSKAIANNRRIWAVVRGTAVNQDGRSNGLTAPSRSAQVDVINRALAAARVDADDVDYVEAHGSATQLGDAIELSALHDVFGRRSPQRPLHVGAVKSNLGHTQAAAGVAGVIKAALVLTHGQVPVNINHEKPAEAVPADGTIRPVTEPVELPDNGRPSLAGVSSFGWSGTNAHVVLEAAPAVAEPEPQAGAAATGAGGQPELHTLPVSAACADALREQLQRLATWLTERPELNLDDVAHTLQVGRAEHDHRRALVCTDTADAISRLTGAIATVSEAATSNGRGRPRVAFLLPGVGDQYVGLGRELYRSEPVYTAAVDECVELVRPRSGIDLAPMFFPTKGSPAVRAVQGDLAAMLGRDGGDADEADPLHHAELAHPFQFTVEYALAKLLAHRGIQPDLLVGYSLGEYVAACLAGVFSLADALHVVVERARLISAVPDGRMVAVAAGESQVAAAVLGTGTEVDIAALNGPSMTVLSGLPSEIEDVTAQLMADGFACRPLRSAHAFHSSLLEPARDKLIALLAEVPRRPPSTVIVSNLTGHPLTAEQATSAEYWGDHLVGTVRFVDSVQYCLGRDIDAFVELGAGQTLGGLVRQNQTAGPRAAVLGTLSAMWAVGDHRDDRTSMLETCGRLWELGVGVNWGATRPAGGRIVSLPTYPFQRTQFWPELDPDAAYLAGPARQTGPTDHCYAPIWRRDLATVAPAGEFDPAAPLVVFSDTDGIGESLAAAATAAGSPVLIVSAGAELSRDGNRFVIDPTVGEHYGEVFAAAATLGGTAPVQVAHLWSMLVTAQEPRYAADGELRTAIQFGFDSLLLATQAFGEIAAGRGIRLLTVTRGASEIIGTDALAPHQAAVHGLGRVLRSEYNRLIWSGLDLDAEGGNQAETDTSLVRHELLTAPPPADSTATHDALVGWRRGRRWVAGWGSLELDGAGGQDAAAGSPWRADGVYLITGGTRG
ncbi:MAG TPA: beta-ketoacyl synthase N-terminal-like domain-containing protein, partial [Pseudonocardiaceae bacterium]|nr:beta-ketoacyl synthase N-terminal-like domain-containing protein [Pseudonocardiaceae bacterium]